jgi:hypothetical protein
MELTFLFFVYSTVRAYYASWNFVLVANLGKSAAQSYAGYEALPRLQQTRSRGIDELGYTNANGNDKENV